MAYTFPSSPARHGNTPVIVCIIWIIDFQQCIYWSNCPFIWKITTRQDSIKLLFNTCLSAGLNITGLRPERILLRCYSLKNTQAFYRSQCVCMSFYLLISLLSSTTYNCIYSNLLLWLVSHIAFLGKTPSFIFEAIILAFFQLRPDAR